MIKKVLSILKWCAIMLIPLLAFIIAPILYPLGYLLRKNKWVRHSKPFWYLFDDEDGFYGAKYWKEEKGITKDNFCTSYRWSALRNPMWNLHTELKPVEGEEVYINSSGSLIKGGENVALSNVATMFFVNENGDWTNNVGEYLSLKYSIIGTVFLWFTIKNKLYWRFSTVRKVGNKFIEIQLGTGYRHTFRFKVKKVKIYEDYIK